MTITKLNLVAIGRASVLTRAEPEGDFEEIGVLRTYQM